MYFAATGSEKRPPGCAFIVRYNSPFRAYSITIKILQCKSREKEGSIRHESVPEKMALVVEGLRVMMCVELHYTRVSGAVQIQRQCSQCQNEGRLGNYVKPEWTSRY